MYHDISVGTDMSSGFQTQVSMDYKVDARIFEKQVKACKGKDVVFTFDDGGESFITVAAPILEKYGFKGIFFISTKQINTKGFLSTEQIKELDARGHTIGSHTHSHPKNLSLLSYNEIIEEWKVSVDILSTILDKRVFIASIPNGRGSEIVTKAAKYAGITELHTSEPTTKNKMKEGITLVGRYAILRSMETKLVSNIINSRMARLRLRIRWHIINMFKVVIGKYYYNLRQTLVKK